MLTVRNTYGETFVYVAGVTIAPRRKAVVAQDAWDAWIQHSANAQTASMYLEIIPDEATDEQLAARDAGIVADVATMFDDTEPAPDEESRERILDGAVEGILADENPDDFTQLGTIRVDVVRERTGLANATAVEIAEARARVEAEDG